MPEDQTRDGRLTVGADQVDDPGEPEGEPSPGGRTDSDAPAGPEARDTEGNGRTAPEDAGDEDDDPAPAGDGNGAAGGDG